MKIIKSKEMIKFMDCKYPRVTKIIKEAGLIDLKCVPDNILGPASQFGTAVHKMCELWDKADLNLATVDKALTPYLDGWKKFKKDYDVRILGIETHLVSERWKFQGTPDRILWIGGKTAIVDIKSSASIHPATAIQLAGYKILWEENTKEKVKIRMAVQLKVDGTYRVEEYKNKTDESIFLSALSLFYWREKHNLKKEVENDGK